MVFKDADTPWRRARGPLAGLLWTPMFREGLDGEALQWAYARLRRIDAVHRHLILVSDGSPMDGATTLANMVQPDIAFALDVGIAGDTPGIDKDEAQGRLGEGPVILIFDASMIPNTRLRDLVIETAKAENIPVQFDAVPAGGTDAGRFHVAGQGVPALAIGVPSRYIHTHASIIHRDDFDNAVKLLAAVIRRLDTALVDEIKLG